MLSFNDTTMTYDENGNLTSVTNSCGTTVYIWDARNRLIGIEGFDENCNPLSASFKYDALGRRIEKTINGRTIEYLYDGLDIVQEIEDGIVTVNYIRTLNIDEPLARITSDGTIRYYHADALGSIIALTDDLGNVKTQYNYSPFGETDLIGEPSDNPFQYTGRENDGTGLYYYRARYYSPVLRRFVSEDPIRLKGGINFFIYASNNPILFIDIFGLFCVQLGCDYGPLRELKKEKGEWYLYKAFFEGPEKGSLVPIMYLNCWWKRKVIITYGYIETCTFQCWSECGQQSIRTISRLKTFTVETTENTFTGQGFDAFLGSVVYPDPVSWCLIYLKPIG